MTNVPVGNLVTVTGLEPDLEPERSSRSQDRKARKKAEKARKQQLANAPRRKMTWDVVKAQRALLFMAVPLLLYQVLFKYVPVYGWAIAFQDYKPGRGGIFEQEWVGFDNFEKLFTGVMGERFRQVIINTLGQSILTLVVGTFGAIILALL